MAASDQIAFFQRKDHIREASKHVITASFRDRATAAAVTPTNVKYRIDNLTTGTVVLDWTTATAASDVSITITPTQNALQDQSNLTETRQLSVAADYALSTQFIDAITFELENLRGVT